MEQQTWEFELHVYFLINYVSNPYLVVGTVHSGRNPRDVEDKILTLMYHDRLEGT